MTLESKEFLASLEDLEMWEALVSEVCLERLVFLDHLVLLDHWAVLDRLEQLDSLEIVVRLVCGVSLDRLGLKALLDNQDLLAAQVSRVDRARGGLMA